jgi:hypothetical protein
MRKLSFLLILLLLSLMLLAAAASAHAVNLPASGEPIVPSAPSHDEEDEADDEGGADEAEEGDEGEDCGAEEGELCAEEDEGEEAEECVVEDASASVLVVPGSQKVLLRVHYHSFEPATVAIETRLRGAKGGLHLGGEQARFRRAGVFHDSFSLSPKQIGKALAAREFDVDLHPVGTPADCELHLATRGSRRAK